MNKEGGVLHHNKGMLKVGKSSDRPPLCSRRVVKMSPKSWILLLTSAFLLTTLSLALDLPDTMPATATPWEVNLTLRSSLYLPTPRPVQDVYVVLNDSEPGLVYRIERNQSEDPAILAKTAYATTKATPHDTYKLTTNALGPFPKGDDLGFTLDQWLKAAGDGTYTEDNGMATMNVTFHDLVPNGTYSVWCHRVTMPPNFNYEYLPCGASDGSQNTFKADAMGNGSFNLKLEALPTSTNVTFKDYVAMYVTKTVPITTNITWTLIAVVYHSDGQTHGDYPGELGKDAHTQLVHLMYPKPAKKYQEWIEMNPVAAVAPVEVEEKQPGFEGIFALAGLLAVVYLTISRRL